MQIYSQLTPLALNGAAGSAVAMGYFDGIHRGHRAVIQGAVQWAQAMVPARRCLPLSCHPAAG